MQKADQLVGLADGDGGTVPEKRVTRQHLYQSGNRRACPCAQSVDLFQNSWAMARDAPGYNLAFACSESFRCSDSGVPLRGFCRCRPGARRP